MIDKSGMHKIYDKWPEIANESFNIDLEHIDFKDIDHIIFSGMGGSGALGDVFSSILSKKNLHVSVIKGYLLPKTVDSNTLVVTTSVSGDTQETLSVLNSTIKLDCKVIAFSSGGKMQDFCLKNRIEYRKIEQKHSPRASFTSFLYSMLKILENNIPIEKNEIKESINELKKTRNNIFSGNLTDTNQSLTLAREITEIPMIYFPWGLQASAIRLKNSLQENSKIHAITEDIIEACHNGIVSWETTSNIKPILIQGMDDYIKTKERWEILKKYFNEKNIEYIEIKSIKGNILSKLINLMYLFDYSSIYKAVLTNIDPTPVTSIDYVKRWLEK
jgi:glucose/mannose-6-phosphate isomerase